MSIHLLSDSLSLSALSVYHNFFLWMYTLLLITCFIALLQHKFWLKIGVLTWVVLKFVLGGILFVSRVQITLIQYRLFFFKLLTQLLNYFLAWLYVFITFFIIVLIDCNGLASYDSNLCKAQKFSDFCIFLKIFWFLKFLFWTVIQFQKSW